jgi:hypothetical protein
MPLPYGGGEPRQASVCIAVVLALLLFPLAGGAIGLARNGAAGAWIGAGLGLLLALVLTGAPTAYFLKIAKRNYDRRNPTSP